MQELLGRLTALDPEASETLKVVSYFDALVANGAGVASLVRGAAVLAGAPVGCRIRDRVMRMSATGASLPADAAAPGRWTTKDAGAGVVWIERDGRPHANDAMVLERLSIALAITTGRHGDAAGSLETALSPHSTDEERGLALARLRLDTAPTLRAVALRPDASISRGVASSIIVTPWGPARAVLGPPDLVASAVDATDHSDLGSAPAGRGVRTTKDRVHESWRSALVALRLSTPSHPVVDAEELGALLLIAEAVDAHHETIPDVAALDRLEPRSVELLDALAEADSMRAAAGRLGLHHSTVQQQAAGLAAALGFDVRTPGGRVRFTLARSLQRLARPEF